jgi:hypothetical protein
MSADGDTWDERTDNDLKGIGVNHEPPIPAEERFLAGTPENPDHRYRVVRTVLGPALQRVR